MVAPPLIPEPIMGKSIVSLGRALLLAALLTASPGARAFLISADCLGSGGSQLSSSSTLASVACDSGGVSPSAIGRAGVDLGDQALRAYATANQGALSYGAAYLNEWVTIVGGAATGKTHVELTMVVTGAFDGAGIPGQAALGSLGIAGGSVARADYWFSGTGYTMSWGTSVIAKGQAVGVTDLSTSHADIRTALTLDFDLDLAAPTFNLIANLVAWAGGGTGASEVDFGDTALLSIRLADGLSARTDSNVLIPPTPSATVDEPGVFALMMFPGLLLLGTRAVGARR
jgi:hypothetical protein